MKVVFVLVDGQLYSSFNIGEFFSIIQEKTLNNSETKMAIETTSLIPFKTGIHLQFTGSVEGSIKWINHTAIRLMFKSVSNGAADVLVEMPPMLSITSVSFDAQEDARMEANLSSLRKTLNVGQAINLSAQSLTMDDFTDIWKSGIYIFFYGDNEFYIHAPRNIDIGQTGKPLKNKLTVIDEIPTPLLALVDSIYECDPKDAEEANAWIAKTDNAKERLTELRNSSVPKIIADELEYHIIQLDAVSKQLHSTKRRLRKQPVFEAIKKNHLIQLMSEFIEQNHGSSCVRDLEVKALQLASQSNKPATPEHAIIFEKIKAHHLHSLLYQAFKDPSFANLPVHKCHKCKGRWKMKQSAHSKSNAKRFHIECIGCGFVADTPYSKNGHGAVLAWNRANPDTGKSYKDINFLGLSLLSLPQTKSHLAEIAQYLVLMEEYAEALAKHNDSDKKSETNSIIGMTRLLKDAVLYSKHMIKIANKNAESAR